MMRLPSSATVLFASQSENIGMRSGRQLLSWGIWYCLVRVQAHDETERQFKVDGFPYIPQRHPF